MLARLFHGVKMTGSQPWRHSLAAVAACTLLAACGGGGGGQATPPAPTPVAAAGEVGAPVLSGNIPADGLAWINYRRAQIGVPALSRNTLVD
jgi:hypothetical protein